MKTIIKNVKIITEKQIINHYCLFIENEMIKDLINSKEVIDEHYDVVIEGQGQYLAPGFIDIHHHGNSGYDVMDGTKEALLSIAAFQSKHGVTSFLGSTMTNPKENILRALENAKEYLKSSNQGELVSNFLGIHLEGPYLSVEKKGAQPKAHIHNGNLDEINEFITISNNHIKVITIAPELNGSIEIIKRIREKDIYVSLGHSNAKYEEAETAIKAGASIATHLYNGMRGFTHREPGIVGSVLTNDNIYAEIIVDLLHLHPAAIQLAIKAKGTDRVILVSDAMRATGLSDGEYDLGGQTVVVKNGEAHLKDDTIAGSTLTLDKAVLNMVKYIKVPLVDAIKMASLNPAKAIGMDHLLGSIQVGKVADLVLLDENLNVQKVWLKGQLLK
jgi:N-acetylglucosamine-6-phosphate deacetylase